MAILKAERFFLNKTFHDIEEGTCSVKSWNIDFKQIDPGRFRSSVFQIDLDTLQFAHAHFNRQLIQRGSSPPNFYTFAIPASSEQRIIWRGKELPPNSIIVYAPGMEIDAVTWPRFNIYTISAPVNHLENIGRLLTSSDLQKLIVDASVIICKPFVLWKFRQLVRSFCTELTGNGFNSSKLCQKLKSEIL